MIKGPLAAMIFKKGEKMFYKNQKGNKILEEALMKDPEYVKTIKMKNKIVNLFAEEKFTIWEANETLKRVSDNLERQSDALLIDSSFQE